MTVPPSCRAPALVLSPYNVLLFIFGSLVISLVMRAQDPRAPHSFSASSYRAITRPPLGRDRACSIENLLPQPLQVAEISCGISPYLRQRLSQNSSQDNSFPLRQWGTELSHALFLVALWRHFLSYPPARSFCLESSPSSTCIVSRLVAKLTCRKHALWPT